MSHSFFPKAAKSLWFDVRVNEICVKFRLLEIILSSEQAKWVFSNYNKRTRYLGTLSRECFITP